MNRFETKIVTGWIVAGLGIAAYFLVTAIFWAVAVLRYRE